MALRVLDGNQTATTLSSVVTGGEHIVAHSVVSLGSTAIANITNAVSGSVVSISNFPSTQIIAGTVTVGGIGGSVTIPVRLFAEAEGGPTSGQDTLVLCDSSGQLLINAKSGGVSVLGYDGNAFVSVKQVSGSSVTIGSLPAISGTVTANVDAGSLISALDNYGAAYTSQIPVGIDQAGFGNVPISGTVTANGGVELGTTGNSHGFIALGIDDVGAAGSLLLDGEGRLRVKAEATTVTIGNTVTIGSLPAISGTVTAAAPNGSLTTRFGTPTTANTAFATSAVTNANRKYLLIQNVTTGSNVITVGIGFTPTTTQGIQLTAGAGITFESSYIPTGAVYVLSSVTASNFTILEA